MAGLKVVAIAGSIRKASCNQGLLRAAVEIAKTDFPDLDIEILPIQHLPFVNTDLEKNGGFPEDVTAFRDKVAAADAVLFSSPEYNYSMSGILKNAIDWASRPPNQWGGKAAAIVSAGAGQGGARSHYHLRQIGVFIDVHFINKPELFVQIFSPPAKFDQDGDLIDSGIKERMKAVLTALQEFTLRIRKH